jgi:hypothetical protein
MFSSSSNFSKNAASFFSGLAGEMAILPGLLGVLGFALLWKHNKNIFVYALLIILSCMLYSFNYSIIDIQTYYLVVYYFFAFSSSVGLVFLLITAGRKQVLKATNVNLTVVLSGLILIAFSLGFNYKENDNSTNYVNEDITINTLRSLRQNSILLTYDFPFVYSASLYFQQVELFRPDVKVFNVKFLSAPWYLESIRKYYPDIFQTVQVEAEEYIRSYNVDDRNHPARLTNFVKIFFDKIIVNFPVNLSVDCVLSKELSVLLSSYLAVPEGLAYRLDVKDAKYDPDAGRSSLRRLSKYEPIGYHKNKMFVTTPGVYYETAFYHYKNKNYRTSLKFLEKSFEFNRISRCSGIEKAR